MVVNRQNLADIFKSFLVGFTKGLELNQAPVESRRDGSSIHWRE